MNARPGEKKIDVIAVGTLNVDLIMIGDAPREMDALTQWVAPSSLTFTPAGSIGYAAIDMARLGMNVSMLSHVADDFMGRWIVESLRQEGIDTEHVGVEPGLSGIGIYMLLFGSRKRPLTGRLATHPPWPADLSIGALEKMKRARCLHLGGYLHYPNLWGESTERMFRQAKDLNLLTSLDPQFPFSPVEGKWLPLFGELLKYVDILFTDETEVTSIAGIDAVEDAARALLQEGPRLVVVKMGAEGALLLTADGEVREPAREVSEVVDSIGAGDAFDAGVIYGALAQWDLARTAHFAAAVAALTLKGMGGTKTAPDIGMVEDLLAPDQ